jgi:hypothetical protein
MPITYINAKGSPLTPDELDDNFKTLQERIQVLEDIKFYGEGISRITQTDSGLSIHGSLGSVWGPFSLPRHVPQFHTNWEAGKTYGQGDWLMHERKTYLCTKSHVGKTLAEDLTQNWQNVGG